MAYDLETIAKTAKNYADDVRRIMSVDKAYLYGSYAKGYASEYSDVDICFFLRSFDGKTSVEIITELLGLSYKYKNVYIEPNVF
jgi:predicted nucleotidyltransferase